jgi:hypothetical protein
MEGTDAKMLTAHLSLPKRFGAATTRAVVNWMIVARLMAP